MGVEILECKVISEKDPYLQVETTIEFLTEVALDSIGKTLRVDMDILCENTNSRVRLTTEEFNIKNKQSLPKLMRDASSILADNVAIIMEETSMYEVDEDWLRPDNERSEFEGDGSNFGTRIVSHRLVILD